MSYIGNSITQQSFTGGVDQYNGNNSNTVFGLTRTINTVYDVDAYVENVWQRPTTGYTVSANTITFTSAPPAGSNNVVIVYRNFSATSVIPQQGSVTTTSFAANAIPATLGYTPANKAGDTFTGTVTANTLVVSTNTATLGTSLYSIANGNVGLGTSGPAMRLHVQDGGVLLGSGGSGIYVSPTNDNTLNCYLNSDNDDNNFWINYRGYNDGFTRFRQTHIADGKGNAVVTVTGSTRVVSLPYGQLKFPASQNASSDANTLDDYEEGTWTPTDVSGAGLTFTGTYGQYIKVGKLVYVSFNLTYPSTGNTSLAQMGGLPFTVEATGADNGNMAGGLGYVSSGVVMQIHLLVGTTTWRYYNIATSQNNNNLSGITYRGGFVYRASA